ncbi:hypothetical protein SAY87_010705 [Trapa incisa]|uniref:Uncharacterized protein n=2 Tax=Trapa TaxID=22665 RepID=A0AAN7MDX1_TRANT|nr:hypothetical protein SAY87_010705 [Trapa incisa]KAK4795070.1 hypothetical protein SAY86_013064 [Trapa natans]
MDEMASSLASEDQASAAHDIKLLGEYFEGVCGEVLEINNAVLMSLLEDSQGDSQEFDQLNDMIQSLEAEIYQNSTDGHGLGMCIIGNSDEDDENPAANISGRFGSYDWPYPAEDFGWMDMDTVLPALEEYMDWYIEESQFGDEMNCVYSSQVYSMDE